MNERNRVNVIMQLHEKFDSDAIPPNCPKCNKPCKHIYFESEGGGTVFNAKYLCKECENI